MFTAIMYYYHYCSFSQQTFRIVIAGRAQLELITLTSVFRKLLQFSVISCI